ncbi:MAG: hypothetical protein GY953_13895, partial [bacterium]|nr:hypothetical protein [bacterium]
MRLLDPPTFFIPFSNHRNLRGRSPGHRLLGAALALLLAVSMPPVAAAEDEAEDDLTKRMTRKGPLVTVAASPAILERILTKALAGVEELAGAAVRFVLAER